MEANSVQPKLDPKVPLDHPDFQPPKRGNRKVKNPNGAGNGWEAKDGGVWVPTPRMHGGEGWTIQYPKKHKRRHWHAYPDGTTREKELSFYKVNELDIQFEHELQFDYTSVFDNLMYDLYLPSEFGYENNYDYGIHMFIPVEIGEILL